MVNDPRLENGPLGDETRVLVTGASGSIGRHVVEELKARNVKIRALTSRPLTPAQAADSAVDWVQHDFQRSLDFGPHLSGCSGVLHLAAEIWDIPKMQRVNVDATAALARAAEQSQVRFFAYTSSVAVYGSAENPVVTEDSPVLTPDRDVKSEYRGNTTIRAYGRSKLRGERALAAELKRVEYVIFRPTVVVDLAQILAIGERGSLQRCILAKRHEHHIYVKDVAHAMVWFMDRALSRPEPQAGGIVLNLSDDEAAFGTARAFLARAYQRTRDPRFLMQIAAPLWVYNIFDLLKNQTLSRRKPFGEMIFSAEKLYAAGYRHRYGMAAAQDLALSSLTEREGDYLVSSSP